MFRIVIPLFLILLTFLSQAAYAENSIIEFKLADSQEAALSIRTAPVLNIKQVVKAELEVQKSDPPPWMQAAATAGTITLTNEPVVIIHVYLTEEGQEILKDITAQNIGKTLAIFIENELIMAPAIIEKITTGKISITGDLKLKKAEDIVAKINKLKST